MELKIRYQYTYFFYPYIIDEKKYDKYLYKLFQDENCKHKTFEKEKDNGIYNTFLPNVREVLFPSFEYTKEKSGKLEKMDKQLKSIMLAENECTIFDYNLSDIQGKVENKNSIFFKIPEIQIVCFKSGICFLVFKTTIEDSNKFSDMLNFNYKFREINSKFQNLKEYENIKMQTDIFEETKNIMNFIKNITNADEESTKQLLDMDDKFFTYSYVCLEQENWNQKNEFKAIEHEFLKFANILPANYDSSFNNKKLEDSISKIENLVYVRYGISKMGVNMLTSSIDTYNFTKLPHIFENEYLYITLFSLYQKVQLNIINKEMKSKFKNKIDKSRNKFVDFTQKMWQRELSSLDSATVIYNKLKKELETEKIYKEIQKKYDLIYKEYEINKNSILNKTLKIVLGVSIALNLGNIIYLIFN